jgi:hypothetical protein
MARVNEVLSQEEILCQLAEEAAELSQAALKLRRALDRANPTPITPQEAGNRLLEEIADVIVCENQVFGIDWDVVDNICKRKLGRWEGRLALRG